MGDGDTLAPLLGATAVFGVRSEQEAARSLALLGLDPDDGRLRRRLLDFSAGRCLLRDHRRRIEAVRVHVASSATRAGIVDDSADRLIGTESVAMVEPTPCALAWNARSNRLHCLAGQLTKESARNRRAFWAQSGATRPPGH
jgi:hypothetical protein